MSVSVRLLKEKKMPREYSKLEAHKKSSKMLNALR